MASAHSMFDDLSMFLCEVHGVTVNLNKNRYIYPSLKAELPISLLLFVDIIALVTCDEKL